MTKAGGDVAETKVDGQALGEIMADEGSGSAEASTSPTASGRASGNGAGLPGEAGLASASRDAAPG